jgi:hypothetical protein
MTPLEPPLFELIHTCGVNVYHSMCSVIVGIYNAMHGNRSNQSPYAKVTACEEKTSTLCKFGTKNKIGLEPRKYVCYGP